ncbi:hypothetical protein CAOG_008425 [Capsaspora owczarzaki ATCC 30864]|uniref:Uncharacterized protein n=2 Tax=Capsaspora owczarzaki (strain ATCC 30864) TaxID=595528 RepID=A0A0D2WHB1_CAPO3|nr:hypothetical protein CAOG_008425 [Capsaspora owczarzaki ATCC 30864]
MAALLTFKAVASLSGFAHLVASASMIHPQQFQALVIDRESTPLISAAEDDLTRSLGITLVFSSIALFAIAGTQDLVLQRRIAYAGVLESVLSIVHYHFAKRRGVFKDTYLRFVHYAGLAGWTFVACTLTA